MALKTKLKGIDISHHNKYNLPPFDKQDFIIMKATEGVSYKDPMMDEYLEKLSGKTKSFERNIPVEKNCSS